MASLSLRSLVHAAAQQGLVFRGGFIAAPDDKLEYLSNDTPTAALVLFGNSGSSIWPTFSISEEHIDGQRDPLNRWSERIGNALASRYSGKALFPFGGPPYQQFLQWAKKTEGLACSKIGMLIHPQYGLWHAYRFAIALPQSVISNDEDRALLNNDVHKHACDTCASQSCLKSCPVNAFTEGNYDVETCFRYLDNTPQAQCHRSGCQARTSCPEGQSYLYDSAHAAFHMQQFVSALQGRFNKA